jgi:hypothetical protein
MKTTYSTKERLSFKLKGLNSFFASLENAISIGNFKEEERIWKLIFEISEEINKLEIKLIKNK